MRIGGCLVGAMLGWATILLLMPVLTTLSDFLLAMAGPLFLAAWIKSGGARSNYVGQQIAIAYFSCVLSGYGPTIELTGGRDRIVGILLGDVTVFVVFTLIWPASIAGSVRKNLGQALERLADLLAPARDAKAPDHEKLRQAFDKAVAGAQASLADDGYEPGWTRPDRHDPDRERRLIDAASVASVQALVLPASMIAALQHDGGPVPPEGTQDATGDYQAAMADWFRGCARWMQHGTGGGTLLATLPRPPGPAGTEPHGQAAAALSARAAWCGLLHDDAVAMVREIGADPAPAGHQAMEPALAGA